jgi:hypothetical protein
MVFIVAVLTGLSFTQVFLFGLSVLNIYLALTGQTYFELTKRYRCWYLNIDGMPDEYNPFDKGIVSNLQEFVNLNPFRTTHETALWQMEQFDVEKYRKRQQSSWLNHRLIRNETYECC